MRMINKSNSTPMFAQLIAEGPLTAKPRKRNLQQLQNEVNKSRIAIENMSHTRAIDGGLYKRVEQLQKELHHCILSINHQSEKEKILQDLIYVLKGEMSEVQAVQRTSEEVMSCSFQKKIKKVEYDIKQILHKYNEEIAKINWLKEQANAARDERVVYSNLFNKIEKEIKHYEELYKQTLIKNQIFLDKKRSRSLKNSQDSTLPPTDLIEDNIDCMYNGQDKDPLQNISSPKELKLKQKRSFKISDKSAEQQLFITNLKDSVSMAKQQQQAGLKDITSTTRKQIGENRGIEYLIREKECQIQSAIVLSQCRSLDQVMRLYTSLDSQNQNLISQISQMDQSLTYLQEEIDRQLRQKRTSEVYQNRQLTEMVNISKKSRSNRTAIGDSQLTASYSLHNLTRKICEVLGVEGQGLGDDVLREMDRRVDELGCTVVMERRGRRESRLISAEEMGGADRGVCELLQKIDKFGQCQKIFDRNMLKAQYTKQLNKVRKRGKKSN